MVLGVIIFGIAYFQYLHPLPMRTVYYILAVALLLLVGSAYRLASAAHAAGASNKAAFWLAQALTEWCDPPSRPLCSRVLLTSLSKAGDVGLLRRQYQPIRPRKTRVGSVALGARARPNARVSTRELRTLTFFPPAP